MIAWAIEALVASTVLMLVVLALRGPVAARFGAHAAYLLWLLPASRMVLPRLPEAAAPIRAVPIHFDISRLVAANAASPQAAAAIPAATQPGIDWLIVALVVWLGGAAVYLAWQLGRHHRFMTVALERAAPGFRRGGIKVRLSPVVSGPLAAGIFHRHILLPDDFEHRYNGAEQQLALAHELAHHRRGDLIANSVALVMLALHWFNPIAHFAYRAFRADQELACDATVLAAAPDARSDYGRALIKSARAGMPPVACALGPATQLKRRMKMIAHSTGSRPLRIVGASLAVLTVGLGLGLTASGSIAAPSKVAPTTVKSLFEPQAPTQTQPRTMLIAGDTARRTQNANDAVADDIVATVSPAAPLAPMAPRAPLAPLAPLQPVSPVPPVAPSIISAEQVRQIQAVSRQASEIARQAAASIDVAAITREAMAQARAELARECKYAAPARPGETDQEAMARLAAGCVDMAEINREVQDALREAIEDIQDAKDISQADRARALAAVERARSEAAQRMGR
jgi:bla regulator protein BlaR1